MELPLSAIGKVRGINCGHKFLVNGDVYEVTRNPKYIEDNSKDAYVLKLIDLTPYIEGKKAIREQAIMDALKAKGLF